MSTGDVRTAASRVVRVSVNRMPVDARLVPEFDGGVCALGVVCGGGPVGGYLVTSRETGYDVPSFAPYVALDVAGVVVFVCADCWDEVVAESSPAEVEAEYRPGVLW